MDIASNYTIDDPSTERRKRVFWSLQILEQSYGQQEGLLTVSVNTWRPLQAPNDDRSLTLKHSYALPPLPTSIGAEPEIWTILPGLGWLWSRVRQYVQDTANHRLKEPWRHDSAYTILVSDLMELETAVPMCHRYDSVKFYQRAPEEINNKRDYWVPWSRLQFMYHAIQTVLNHPFLYIIASERNQRMSIPNTFWRRSTELVLMHATWTVRLIDMVIEKRLRLLDPFFAQAAAIAATVHLYYCCAADVRLKLKSRADVMKCRQLLESMAKVSESCRILVGLP